MNRSDFLCSSGVYRLLYSIGRYRRHRNFVAIALVSSIWLSAAVPTAQAAPCLIVTLTGTGPGPGAFGGLAGAGTLVRYGEDGNDRGAVKLQFDILHCRVN
jgi:hypothetical protein